MNIIFFGTPDFAVPVLQNLLESKHEISAVVTAPDKQRGRGRKVTSTAVKLFAEKMSLEILQPEKLKDQEFISQLKKYEADIFIVVAYRILPPVIFKIPPKGTFNLHGSLLPKYRGAAPIQWALINGETETGLTTFFIDKKVDTGNVILQEKVVVENDDNFGSLHDKMSLAGANLVLKTVALLESGNYTLIGQDDSLATPAPKITKEICRINWNLRAEVIHNLVRGLSPYPGAFFIHNNSSFKIYKTKLVDNIGLMPGEFRLTKKNIFAGCKNSTLEILEIQPEGRKRLSSQEFVLGYKL